MDDARLVVCITLVQRQDFVPKHALYLWRQRCKGVIGHVGLMIVGLLQVADGGQRSGTARRVLEA